MGTQLPFPPATKGHPQFFTHVCCGQTAYWIKVPLGTEVGLRSGEIVLDETHFPLKGGSSPHHFSAHVLWPNGWIDQDTTWYRGRPLPRPHCVRWESSSPPLKRGTAPQFSAHVCCGQIAELIKMPFFCYGGRPRPRRHCVRWGPSAANKGAQTPIFGPCLLWQNGRPSQLF